MTLKGLTRWAGALLLAVGLLSGGMATAQTGATALTQPSAPPLWDQTDSAGSNAVDSSNEGNTTVVAQAADDFVVPNNVFWHISTVTVAGQYFGSGGSDVLSLIVQVYGNSASSLPGPLLFSETIPRVSISGLNTATLSVNTSSATFGPGHYWLSAQAQEQCSLDSPCKAWYWTERTTKKYLGYVTYESAFQDPPGILAPACKTWQPRITVCHRPSLSTNPDLLFKLDGTTSPIKSMIFLPLVRR